MPDPQHPSARRYTLGARLVAMMSHGIASCLTLVVFLPAAPVLAWTEADLRAAERRLEHQLAPQRAAEAAEVQARAEAESARKSISAVMVKIPAGEFLMGCSPGDCADDEQPPHRVKLKAYRMGKYEVTQAQWRAVMGTNPARFLGDDRPVEHVSWDDIQDFLRRLNAGNPGPPYRLPSEAEWEYAARAGTLTPYWWGRAIGTGQANCDGCGSRWGDQETAPVGSFPANPFGLHDTAGNVREWVADCWHKSYRGAPADGTAWQADCSSNKRVLRGGSWTDDSYSVRVSYRMIEDTDARLDFYGLRLAQDLNP